MQNKHKVIIRVVLGLAFAGGVYLYIRKYGLGTMIAPSA